MTELLIHPTDEALRDFALGKLSGYAGNEIESHVAGCPDCQARAAGGAADTFVALLTSAHIRNTVAPAPSTPAFSDTLAWTGEVPAAGPGAPAELVGHPKYKVLRRLGVGGMGTVWLAEHTVMNRLVAVKVIRPDILSRAGVAERFLREVRAAAQLQHPNVVAAFDAEQTEGSCLLAMEYVAGRTLAELAVAGSLPVADACRAVRDAARGLAYAHAAGLVHRDVKPGNLIRALDGTTKVLDFGLVTAVGNDDGLTGENMVLGTPDYIAPEQVVDARSADARADIYSLGCTLYHLLAGRIPFPANTVMKKLDAHRHRDAKPIAGIPDGLARIVAKMMAKNPAARHQTADEVARVLEPFSTVRTATAPPRPRRDRRWLVAAAAVILTLGIAAGAGAVVQHRIKTDKGELVIETTDADVEVVVKQGGKVVTVIDTKTNNRVTLRSGVYEFEVNGKPTGLTLDIDRATLKRGDVVLAKITRHQAAQALEPSTSADERPDGKFRVVQRFPGHSGAVGGVALSPDGRLAVTAGDNGTPAFLRLWDVATGKELRRFEGHGGTIHSPRFTPDGKRIVSSSRDGTVRLWEVATGREVRDFAGHIGEVWGADVSADGDRVLTGCHDGVVRLFDLGSGKLLKSLEGHKEAVVDVVLSVDGRRAFSCSNATVVVWDVATGKEIRRVAHEGFHLRCVAVSPDGRHALTGGIDATGDVGLLVLWDIETGREVRRFTGNEKVVYRVAFTADGRRAVSAGGDGAVRLWDIETGQAAGEFAEGGWECYDLAVSRDGRNVLTAGTLNAEPKLLRLPAPTAVKPGAGLGRTDGPAGGVRTFSAPGSGSIRAVAYSPDGTQVLSGSGWPAGDGFLRLWDVATGKPVWAVKQLFWITAVAFAPGDRIVVGGSVPHLCILDRKTGATLDTIDGNDGGDTNSIAVSPDGRSILTGSRTVRLWDMATRKPIRAFGSPQVIYAVAFSPDGKLAAAGSSDGTVRVWDAATGLPKFKDYRGAKYKVGYGVAFTRDGRHLLLTDEGSAVLWDYVAGKAIRTYPGGAGWGGAALALSPDGKWLLTGGGDKILRLFDLDTGKAVKEFAGHNDRIWDVAFSPDGRFALSGSGGRVSDDDSVEVGDDHSMRRWRLPDPAPTPALLQTDAYSAHKNGFTSDLKLAPDGKTLVSLDATGEAFVRDYPSGKLRLTFPTASHSSTLIALAPDGGRLAAGGGDHATIYDLKTGVELQSFTEPGGRVRGVQFTGDGKRLLVCGLQAARLWDLATEKERWAYADQEVWFHHAILSKDEKTCFVASGGINVAPPGRVLQIDMKTGRVLQTIHYPEDTIGYLALSPDGMRLAGARKYGVTVWEIATGKSVLNLKPPGFAAQCVAFAPDGNTIVTNADFGGQNKSQGLGVWDAKSGRLLAEAHTGINIYQLTVARDGAIVSGAHDDGIVRVWKLSPR